MSTPNSTTERNYHKLEKLYGVGPVLAEKLIKKYKLDLKKPIKPQLKKSKIYSALPAATKADLKYNPSRKIPHVIIKDIAKTLKRKLKGIRHEIAGSFRRKKPFSRDIDLIVSSSNPNPQKIIEKINKYNKKFKVIHIFAQGNDKVSAIISYKSPISNNKKINIKADIFYTDPSEYMFMLLFATGSGKFNIRMRSVAKRKGYLLNQRGLYRRINPNSDVVELIPIKTERELFKFLNIRYLKPEDRKK